MKFEELNLAPALLKAVLEQGYETPTPIQAQAIPAVLAGHDLLAGDQSGELVRNLLCLRNRPRRRVGRDLQAAGDVGGDH